ncbi:cleavage and polyadenylation specificity factor subunit 7 [Protopterus annectens]|uniref:cleavage and polyadenylation specificity factor subunit 7 n=1 Tax=Protopterus annectens TaxID=7888 RepID=UPI001CFA8F5B|nr:cleavage and polyadenylation specificity factor subunit 7 [Protopterus annectens]
MSEAADLIDIYADEFNQESELGTSEPVDLYDDVLAVKGSSKSGSNDPSAKGGSGCNKDSSQPAILYTYSGLRNKKAAVYVGNFSWWATDQDLLKAIKSVGVSDVVDVKFAENRANGQSKGYALVVVSSENSVHRLLENLQGKKLFSDTLEVRLSTRQNLNMFETLAKKRMPQRANARESTESTDLNAKKMENAALAQQIEKPPPVRLPFFNRPAFPDIRPPSVPIPPIPPPVPMGYSVPPPPIPGMTYPHMVPPPPRIPPHLGVPPPGSVPPSLHLNPAFFPPPSTAGISSTDPYTRPPSTFNRTGELESTVVTLNEAEFEEIMNRNRAISSSAISKAVAGASTGEYADAIETLLTAIAVLKQSKVSSDERCKVLISSLQDCLQGIESRSYGAGSRKRHRSRSPPRVAESSRKYRERSYSPDPFEDYFRDKTRERYRERERDLYY